MTALIPVLLVAGLAILLLSAATGLAAVLVGAGGRSFAADGPGTIPVDRHGGPLPRVARWGVLLAFVVLLVATVVRALAVGHAPWSNLHEFSVAFAVALLGTHLALGRSVALDGLAPLTALLAAGLVLLAMGLDDRIDPLVPALQQPVLLTVHVGTAVLAYAVSGLAFVAALGEIAQGRSADRIPVLPSAADARALGHRAVVIAFPILTIAIALGSVWANLAWRSYWNNDPKELAAAATWLVFGAYLHVAGRRDRYAALAPWLIVLGFAGVVFTYVGAGLFFVGEHSYGVP